MRVVSLLIGTVLLSSLGWGQSHISLDYAADVGECEVDINQDGIADGWISYHSWGNQPIQDVGAIMSISSSQRFRGIGSQQITFHRASGAAGQIIFQCNLLAMSRRPTYIPPEGTPLLFRVRIQTQNLQGITPRVCVRMGDRYPIVIASSVSANTSGWQTFSGIVPLERTSDGAFVVHFVVEFNCQEGPFSGTVWIDAVECLWMQFSAPQRARPNPLSIAHHIAPVNHWMDLLAPPPDLLITNIATVMAVKKHLTNLPGGIYLDPASTRADGLYPLMDLYGGYQWVLQNRPSWLLRDASGQPLRNPGYPYLYLVDIGLPAVRQQAIHHLEYLNQKLPLPEWLFLDGIMAWWPSVQYPTMDSAFPAWTGYLQEICPYIRNTLRRKVIINLGSWAGNFVDNNPGVGWLSLVDGVMLEHVVVAYSRNAPNYRYQPYRHNRQTLARTDGSWWATLRAVTENRNTTWLLVVMWDNTNIQMFRYILASYFIFQHQKTYLMVEDRGRLGNDTYRNWVSRPEVWVPLGQATGSWYIVAGTVADNSGALFARNYQYGTVLVNPTEERTYSYRVPRAYKNWDGNLVAEGTVLQIGPKTGVVLYAAPEITLTITPSSITALPGETVTLTVEYRNQGLSDAT
ncbi:MAG: hypothetical protein ABDI19_12690, partial [Armatimonadota bacterium]